jgi:hypothetical protein
VDYKVSPICDFPEYVLTGTEHNHYHALSLYLHQDETVASEPLNSTQTCDIIISERSGIESKLAGTKIESQTNAIKWLVRMRAYSKYIVHCPEFILKLTINYLKTMYRMSILAPFILLPLTAIGGSMIPTIPLNVPFDEAQGQNTSLATPDHSLAINVTIGDLIVEGPATSTGFRALDLGTPNTGPKIEASFIGNATGGINATDMGTLQTIMNSDGTSYSEGKGILTSVSR